MSHANAQRRIEELLSVLAATRRELAAAENELDRLRPVAEKAKEWRLTHRAPIDGSHAWPSVTALRLAAAVDTLNLPAEEQP